MNETREFIPRANPLGYDIALMNDTPDSLFSDSGNAYDVDDESRTIYLCQELYFRIRNAITNY